MCLNVWLFENFSQCTSVCTISTFSTLWQRVGALKVLCHIQHGQQPAATHTLTRTYTQKHAHRPMLWLQAPGRARSANSNTVILVIRGKALTWMNLSMQIHPISSDKTPPHVQMSRTTFCRVKVASQFTAWELCASWGLLNLLLFSKHKVDGFSAHIRWRVWGEGAGK